MFWRFLTISRGTKDKQKKKKKSQKEKEKKKSGPQPSEPAEKKKPRAPARDIQRSQMLIKRSVSPDKRIDSLSVEFSTAIDWNAEEDIKQQAQRALTLENEIVKSFFQTNG